MHLSLHQERYIETIFELTQNHGHAHVRDIAEKLEIKMASVSEAVQLLSEMGLANYQPRQAVTLTANGHKIGQELNRRHSILAKFFEQIIKCEHQHSEILACDIEHLIDNQTIEKIALFIAFIEDQKIHPEFNILEQFKKYQQTHGPSTAFHNFPQQSP